MNHKLSALERENLRRAIDRVSRMSPADLDAELLAEAREARAVGEAFSAYAAALELVAAFEPAVA